MSVAQWAPWVSVFLGGCLSGAALLSLTGERATDSKQAVVVVPPPSPPSEPSDPTDEEVSEADPAEHAVTAHPPSDAEPRDPPEGEEGPSAADILSALEQAYQRQIAAAELAAAPEPEASEEETPTDQVVPPAEPALVRDDQAIAIAEAQEHEQAPAELEHEDDSEPVATAAVSRAEQNQETVQQIAVVYQPVYVLPPGGGAEGQRPTPSSTRSVGRDPWAPLTISPRHNPWASTAASGGAWSTTTVSGGAWAAGNVAGGVWSVGFRP